MYLLQQCSALILIEADALLRGNSVFISLQTEAESFLVFRSDGLSHSSKAYFVNLAQCSQKIGRNYNKPLCNWRVTWDQNNLELAIGDATYSTAYSIF